MYQIRELEFKKLTYQCVQSLMLIMIWYLYKQSYSVSNNYIILIIQQFHFV